MSDNARQITAYVNAYAVTRHYGGPEEGGWWYNAGVPLASIPIRATATLHPPVETEDEANACEHCQEVGRSMCPDNEIAYNEDDARLATAWLEHQLADVAEGDIYSVLGGTALSIQKDTVMAYRWPAQRPHYE